MQKRTASTILNREGVGGIMRQAEKAKKRIGMPVMKMPC